MKKVVLFFIMITLLFSFSACKNEKTKKICFNCGQGVSSEINICNYCGAIMDRKEDPEGGCDILVCPNCGEKIDEMDYEYEYDEENDDDYDNIFASLV